MEESQKIPTSIIKNVHREGMPATFRLCRDDRKYGDVLFSNVENLKSMIRAGMGEDFLASRNDISGTNEWFSYCQAVSNGFSYCYAVDVSGEPPFKVKTLYDFPPTADKIAFDVVGLMPESDLRGWIFTTTSIRQQEGVPDITSSDQIVFVSSYQDDYVLSRYVDFVLKSSYEKNVVKAVNITNTSSEVNELRQYEGKSDEDLRQLLIEMVTKVGVDVLSTSTTVMLTIGSDRWSFIMKKYEIEF